MEVKGMITDDILKDLLFTLLHMTFATPEERDAIWDEYTKRPWKGGDAYDVRESQEDYPERTV